MIDCDVHIEIPTEEFLQFVEPGQRDWFRRSALGLPGDLWSHPSGWFRDELDASFGEVACTPDVVAREALDAIGADIGVLNGDLGIYVSLMPSAYRAAAFARAHNDWLREVWFPADARFRGSIVVPAQDPQAAAREIERCADDPRFLQVVLIGGSERPYGDPRYLPILEAAHACGLPFAVHSGGEGLGLAAPPGGAGMPTFYIEWHTLGSACSIMAHLVSLVVHGTFERLPELRVVLMEGGLAWLPGHPLAARHQLARPAQRDPVAGAAAERGRARARALHDPAAGAHGRPRRPAAGHARGGRRARHPALRVRLPALGLRRPQDHARAAAGGVAPGDHARQRRRPVRRAPGTARRSSPKRDRRRARVPRCERWRHSAQQTGRASSGAAWRCSRSRSASSSSRST